MAWSEERKRATSERMKKIWANRSGAERERIFAKSAPKIAKAHAGRKRSPEMIESMRQAALKNSENRSRAALTRWEGTTHEERVQQLIPAINAAVIVCKGKPLSPEAKKKLGIASKKLWEENRDFLMEKLKEAHSNPEEKERKSRKSKEYWELLSDEEKATHPWVIAGQEASFMVKMSSLERAIATELDLIGIDYIHQKRIGRYVADFFLEKYGLLVECDGEHWHERPETMEKDIRRDAYMRERGYETIRLKGKDIKSNAKKCLLNALEPFHEQIKGVIPNVDD